ncbi:hypothetical protein A2V68_01190 [candidate division Kazan bacterium RBG_13_50_9]|uniref:PDZ domain-containing protein n=1 Tax=candidate division Kazan bacterium RBG_13_50_9 TaxID=1798535 RepID=A0A1F4NSE8_UNCK3|nr:MAG: hypothetical protein A2V68_01190 [candidate division Kazan bacterium RBG_13_50_9]
MVSKQYLYYLGYGLLGGIVGGIAVMLAFGSFSGKGANPATSTQQYLTLEENSALIEAVDKVSPSVVSIVSSRSVRSIFGGVFEQTGGGTGFVIRENGLIATNRHVVADSKAEYKVVTADGKTYDAQIVATDPFNDLAVVKINARDLPVADLGDSDQLKVGQRVVAIGNALGQYQNTVTSGIVSAVDRVIIAGDGSGDSERLEGVIQTDAGINPGNSGGPLVNMAGQVVGINTAIDLQGQVIGFAIPINGVKLALESVLATGTIKRAMLGIRYIQLTKEFAALNNMSTDKGALVTRGNTASELAVTPGGPADKAGIKENDIIVSIDGEEIDDDTSLTSILSKHQPGDTVGIKLLRGDKTMEVSVKLGELQG